ncbi:hypothetical protein A3G67_01855 [Candidatus Roizmanbacteria bacterium RIFCSPLOWO2_12_FULL_40_12]|uniref:Uncharacterized protein n=1 Tax=Candidatus Roizmanbacteria bacterium RIFCSPLOWO2_01_FULL_40_42 TaxID=1802066 RepID=A0A1F7J3I4_9BACT|nr:MAG: hypothetical protein A2779_00975 [Candidatus Roizmanbacteria bacterium RIFCSPHIGHO2_01_FULL_40_98]OGK28939.1 MAG: hypothetical protein A3C31_01615 [Candidatus Roizmanbacteria bacterium RIFCSPHIGHO2_02_FULL_40_53]OGK29595.1 MAG: hypothetical protein A2W49_03925 [Candidatus Roizmanbacteria bacterium RIFCSPHIGHO2_12_41_18]OGK36700.1 MAG: hypothetical protein A3E69_03815 [Candidatus Roizmanbacteria bacterium RIFCSPHIGHO2_12_FULL_40_130]OGK50168.1 MAG: hypothetical protein A3B50_00070 [Candi
MDTTQILLAITLSVTTIFLIIVGVQVFLLLRELRDVMRRANNIIEGFERVGMGVESGFNEVVGFFSGVKSVFKILDTFKKKKDEK